MADTQDNYGFLVDAQGNSLNAVKVPITGRAAFAPYSPDNVIPDADMGASPLTLPAGYLSLGLFKEDGGFADGRDDSDAINLYQQGYSLPGSGSRTVTIGLAEENAAVQQLIEGKTPDANGIIYVDSSLPENRFILFTLERFKNKYERRRNGVAQLTSVEYDQSTRGEVEAVAATFTWQEDDLFDGSPFKQWYGLPGGVKKAVTGVTLTPATLSVAQGAKGKLTAGVQPTDATMKNVTLTSTNTGIATVDSQGNVNGVKAGTCKIVATSTADLSKLAVSDITVTAPSA